VKIAKQADASSSLAAAALCNILRVHHNREVSIFDVSNHHANLAGGQLQQQHIVEQSASVCCRST
jgi:hypothetical protein